MKNKDPNKITRVRRTERCLNSGETDLTPRETLDFRLAAHGLLLRREGFIVCQLHRTAGLGVFRTDARVVRRDAFFEVVRPAAVQRPVRAAQEIGVAFPCHYTLPTFSKASRG